MLKRKLLTVPRTSAAAALAVILGFVSMLGFSAATPFAATQARSDAAAASSSWLDRELVASGVGFAQGGSTDWGLTVDALIALGTDDLAGQGEQTALEGLVADVDSYVTWDAYGAAYQGVLLSGPIAKSHLALSIHGLDPATVTGRDLQADLVSLMVISGPEAGRFSDVNPVSGDQSNMFGQAWAILALDRTPSGIPAKAVDYALSQQCASGAFPLLLDAAGCVDESEADTDATALAVQALLATDRTPQVEASLSGGVRWLLGKIGPDGAVGGTGPTAAANTNSASLVSQALGAAGRPVEADLVSTWVGSLQLTDSNSAGTPASSDLGAVAYSPSALTTAQTSGLPLSRDQWRRATSQAILGLDGTALSNIGRDLPEVIPPVSIGDQPVTTTVPTTVLTTSSTVTSTTVASNASSTSSTTTVVTTTAPENSTTSIPSSAPTTAAAALSTTSPSAGVLGASQSNTSSGQANASASTTTSVLGLAVTGSTVSSSLFAALILLATGVFLMAVRSGVARGTDGSGRPR